jgi:pyridoxal 5'-phosphate synthase pdxT subunit
METRFPRIGILALQGGYADHRTALLSLGGCDPSFVRNADDLDGIDGIILPGGESTAVGRLLERDGFGEILASRIRGGLPAWGTCMGLILLAKRIEGSASSHMGVLDATVARNVYGGQLDSFIASADIAGIGSGIPLVFIRAPAIIDVGKGVEVLARLGGAIVACRQEWIIATTFHPELSQDRRFHGYFLRIVRNAMSRNRSGKNLTYTLSLR